MSEKTGDLTLAAFMSRAKESLSAEWSAAIEAKITEDELKVILENNYNDYKDVALSRTLGHVRKQIKNKIKIANSTKVKGCLIGSRDKVGKNSPIRYLLLRPDKKHIEVSNFGKTTIFKADEEFEIPCPSITTVMVEYDPEYRTYNLQGIDEVKEATPTIDKLVEILKKSMIEIKELKKDMCWSKEKSATPFVIYGEIAGIKPEVTGFIDQPDGSKKVAGHYNVYVTNESKKQQPCFSFGIKSSGGKYIRCHIERQNFGEPSLIFDDLDNICKRAVSKHPDDPSKQTDNLKEWLEGTKVFVAGVMTQYKESFNSDGKAVTNIEIGAAAVIEYEMPTTQTPQTGTEKAEELSSAAAKSLDAATAKPESPSGEGSGTTTMPATLKQAIADLTLFCEAADIDPSTLTIETIRKRALSRLSGIPDGIILEAIDAVKKAGK